jgi:hypothetical protein
MVRQHQSVVLRRGSSSLRFLSPSAQHLFEGGCPCHDGCFVDCSIRGSPLDSAALGAKWVVKAPARFTSFKLGEIVNQEMIDLLSSMNRLDRQLLATLIHEYRPTSWVRLGSEYFFWWSRPFDEWRVNVPVNCWIKFRRLTGTPEIRSVILKSEEQQKSDDLSRLILSTFNKILKRALTARERLVGCRNLRFLRLGLILSASGVL